MRLINFLENDVLNSYRMAMGAPLSYFKIKISLPPPIFRPIIPPEIILPLPTEGLEVEYGEIKSHSDGTLLYKNKRVLVHIRDASKHEPRFHLSNCITLVEMRSAGRFEKYVVSESEDSYFYIRMGGGPLNKRKLIVCQNCLDKLSWKGFSRDSMSRNNRQIIVMGFSIKEFFIKFPRSLHPVLPIQTVITAPVNDYPENWALIAGELKRQLGYVCQNCHRAVGEKHKTYLHVHHMNSLKNDCRVENLKCLCIYCHANEFNHGHLKTTPDYLKFKEIFHIE